MKFDLLVCKLLNEANPEKKLYRVEFSRLAKDYYGLNDANTKAFSKKQAVGFVVNDQLGKKHTKKELALIIWKIRNKYGVEVKEKNYKISSTQTPINTQNPDEQMNLKLEAFDLEKKEGLHGWFKRNKGKGWVNCKRSRKGHIVPCGRSKGTKSGKGYPACRPTLSMCSGSKAKKKSHKSIKWKKKT